MTRLAALARLIASRQDLALIALLLMTIFMIILPLPTWLIDVLIGLNLSLVVLIMVVAVYLESPTSLSTLPAILLFSTLFRLAISISTTRLILVQADAGQIVDTFGEFVVSGNLVVGIVVFLIITVVQFIVITKGSERVAEVSARFSLDALPGRQMSIDSDMRSGEIDMAEAKRRRGELQLTSEFYGSMDGAMKFVKGDAIAGIIIIFINLLAGIAIGVMQNGMDMSEAVSRYSVLTVGDGLVSQIPALLMAISSGIVITRITNDTSSDLGHDIAGQMAGSPRALQIAGGVLLVFAMIPGFPTMTFIALATFFGGLGFLGEYRRRRQIAEGVEPVRGARDQRQEIALTPMSPVHLAVGSGLAERIDKGLFASEVLVERSRLFDQLGVPFPPVILTTANGPPDRWQLIIEAVPVDEGTIPLGRIRLTDDPETAEIHGLDVEERALSPMIPQSYWVDASAAGQLKRTGVAFEAPESVLAMLAAKRLPKHAQEFLGVQETGLLLSSMEARYDDLVKEAQKALPLQKIAQVLRRLVEEEVPVRNMRVVLETIVEWAGREKDADILSEYVRTALARQICHRYSDDDRFLAAYVVEADVEDTIREAIKHASTGSFLSLDPRQARSLLDKVKGTIGDLTDHASTPVFLSTMDVRRFLRRFLSEHGIDLPVLSHKEIDMNYKVQPLAMVTMS